MRKANIKPYLKKAYLLFSLVAVSPLIWSAEGDTVAATEAEIPEFAPAAPVVHESASPTATINFTSRDREFIRESGLQGKFLKMLDSPSALAPHALNDIDTEVHNLAFYRMSDRQHKRFPKTMYESIEQKMINKFTSVKRFGVHECLECKTTRVLLRENQFSILRQLDSNEKLSEVGDKIGVDHFILWDAYTDQTQAVINLRVVSAAEGRVRWSRQFRSGEVGKVLDREFYTSFWGIGAKRVATESSEDTVIATPMIATGFRLISRSTVSDHIYYAYGIEFFSNTTYLSTLLATGLNINGRLALEIDSLFSDTKRQYGNWLLYFSLGQAFIINNPAVMSGVGLEIKPTRKSFIDFGALYMAPTSFVAFPKAGFADEAEIGGLGYEITLGYRF